MQNRSKTVSFRLEPYHLGLLDKAAAARGRSPGEYARELVIEAVTGVRDLRVADELSAVGQQLRGLGESVTRLEKNHRTAVVAILTDAGQASLEDAVSWVNDHFEKG
jgi:predicted DNA-binding protein